MPSEKFFVHKEDGSLVRLKGRLVRFLDEEPPTGSDKSAIRTALEVSPDAEGLVQADIGTGPNQIPTMGMLGTMSLQDAAGVSMGVVEADSLDVGGQSKAGSLVVYDANGNASNSLDVTYSGSSGVANIQADSSGGSTALTFGTSNAGVVGTRMTIDSSGRVGIGTSSPGSFALGANELVVGDGAAGRGITVYGSPSTGGALYFADGTTGTEKERGFIYYNHAADEMRLGTAANTRWTINATGDLVSSGGAIDFGSVSTSAGDGTGTTGTVDNSLLADYEVGSWTPTFASSSATFSYTTQSGRYVKVGKQVTAQFYLLATASGTTSNAIKIYGLPFVASAASGTGFDQFAAAAWFTGSNAITWLTTSNAAEMIGWAQNSAASTRTAADVSGQYVVGTLTYEATT
jgi:hypothetical protein